VIESDNKKFKIALHFYALEYGGKQKALTFTCYEDTVLNDNEPETRRQSWYKK